MASSPAAAAKIPKQKPSAGWRKGVPELPATSPELQRAALAGIMQQLHAEDPGLTRGELTKQAIQAFPQRHNKAEAVLVIMDYCQQNDEDYDPLARVGKPPGPHTADASPAAVTRAQTACRKEGASRAAVAKYNELAEKEGDTQIGAQNHQLLWTSRAEARARCAASGARSSRCSRR